MWVFTTPWWTSEAITWVFIASSVWKLAVNNSNTGMTGLTLKTRRILLMSDFQAAIVSLSFFAWRSRKAAFLPLCLMILLWISATVLRPRSF